MSVEAGSESAEPESPEPESAEPESAEPESAEPESAEPESAEPESAGPESAGPESAEPESAASGDEGPAPGEGAAETAVRLRGLDVARAVAILGMVLINFQVFLLARDDGSSALAHWAAHLPSGRSSGLFVTLAGVGIGLMSQGAARRAVRWTLLSRAAFLLVAGNLLILVWSIDILHFYAFYLGLGALLLLALPRRALPIAAAALALAAPLLRLAFPEVTRPDDSAYWTPLGMAQNVVGWGIHPVLPWLGFIAMGLWVGRHDLAHAPTRRRLMLVGGALAVGAPLLSSALLYLCVDAQAFNLVRYLGTRWSPAPLYIAAASGSSIVIIGACQELAERAPDRWLVRALVATGQLSLTLYLLHALLGVGVPRWAFGLEHGLSLPQVSLGALGFCVAAVPLAWLWRRRFARGPAEWLLRKVTRRTPSRDPAALGHRLVPAPPLLWAPVATLAALAVGQSVVGARLDLDCGAERPLAAATSGELTLVCTHRSYAFELEEAAEVTLETHSSSDLYLELYRGGERVAENDDGGEGLDSRIVRTLEPGRYRARVRPYRSATGGFALTRWNGPPRVDRPGCSNTCASSHDDECDDGGADSLYDVCELGTDCADCGAR